MIKVSIISVNYNQDVMTEAFINSVLGSAIHVPYEIIIVDNGSRSNPIPAWTVKYPSVRFYRCEINIGFAGGNNIAVKEAIGEYLFLVNNDTEFTDGLVDMLAETLDNHPETGVVSPKIRYYDQKELLQYVGFSDMNYFTARNKCLGHMEKDNGQYDSNSGVTSFANGAAMMVRRAAIDKAGMMTEIYFLYYEEMDWCEHIKKAGYNIRVNLSAVIFHKESITVGRNSALKEYFMNRNRVLYIRRNAPAGARLVFYVYFLLVVTPRNILGYIKKKQYNFIPVLFKAIYWNLTNGINSEKLGYLFQR